MMSFYIEQSKSYSIMQEHYTLELLWYLLASHPVYASESLLRGYWPFRDVVISLSLHPSRKSNESGRKGMAELEEGTFT